MTRVPMTNKEISELLDWGRQHLPAKGRDSLRPRRDLQKVDSLKKTITSVHRKEAQQLKRRVLRILLDIADYSSSAVWMTSEFGIDGCSIGHEALAKLAMQMSRYWAMLDDNPVHKLAHYKRVAAVSIRRYKAYPEGGGWYESREDEELRVFGKGMA